MDPCDYGWEQNGKSLSPVMLPAGAQITPDEVLNITHCKCALQKCKNIRCSCVRIGVKCNPEFCEYVECCNEQKICLDDSDSDIDSDVANQSEAE